MSFYCAKLERRVLRVEGVDSSTFLQGLVTADLRKVNQQSLYSAFLTPQGKFLEDLFITLHQGVLFVECSIEYSDLFKQKLSMYKLRSDVTLSWADEYKVFAFWGDESFHFQEKNAIFFKDPRLAELGFRAYLIESQDPCATEDQYDFYRMSLGVPDGRKDLIREKSILLENGFDELGAISWDKGCYLGQELTSRTKYRGLVRKRLFPFKYEGKAPDKGSLCYLGDNEVGIVQSVLSGMGLGLFRLEFIDKMLNEDISTKGSHSKIKIFQPNWMKLET